MKFEQLYFYVYLIPTFLIVLVLMRVALHFFTIQKERVKEELAVLAKKYNKYFREWAVHNGILYLGQYQVRIDGGFSGFRDTPSATPFLDNKSTIERRALWEEVKRELDRRADFFKP